MAGQNPVRRRAVAVPVDAPPMRVSEAANVSALQKKSIFDGANPHAQLSQVNLRPDPFVSRPRPASPRPRVVAQPVLGEDPPESAVKNLLQREMSPQGISGAEATVLAEALKVALEATSKALEDKIACGQVDSVVYQEVKKIQASLEQFGASNREGRAELTSDEIRKMDSVLACQKTYEQVSTVKKQRTIAFVAGGILLVGIVIAVASSK